MLPDELADRILNPKNESSRDLLLEFMRSEHFDLMLTFRAGSSELSYTKADFIFERFAHSIQRTDFNYSPLQCSTTATRQLHHETTDRLTNLFYNMYKIPMFTLGLSCCRMPQNAHIAAVWRTNIEKIKNFLGLVQTGIHGLVQNDKGRPLREAFVRLVDHNEVHNVTRNEARFKLILPKGLYGVEVSAPNYESQIVQTQVQQGVINDLGVIKLHGFTMIRGEVTELNGHTEPLRNTSISGIVLDDSNHPIRNAKISVIKPTGLRHLRNFTNSMGEYSLAAVPLGAITLKVEAPRHFEATRDLRLDQAGHPTENVVFHLKFNAQVFGLPRFVFILVASVLIICGVIICVLCAQFWFNRRHRGKRPYYNFSLLPQKAKGQFELDDDAGDDGETELFRSPIKRKLETLLRLPSCKTNSLSLSLSLHRWHDHSAILR